LIRSKTWAGARLWRGVRIDRGVVLEVGIIAKLLLERREIIRERVWSRLGRLWHRLHHLGLGVGVIAAYTTAEITWRGEVELGRSTRSARGLCLLSGSLDISSIERGHAEHGLLPAFLQLMSTEPAVN
jgi:hypothetical protein